MKETENMLAMEKKTLREKRVYPEPSRGDDKQSHVHRSNFPSRISLPSLEALPGPNSPQTPAPSPHLTPGTLSVRDAEGSRAYVLRSLLRGGERQFLI